MKRLFSSKSPPKQTPKESEKRYLGSKAQKQNYISESLIARMLQLEGLMNKKGWGMTQLKELVMLYSVNEFL